MFSSDQLDAIRHAQEILQQAGLQRTDILEVDSPVPIQTFPSLNYTSPHAVIFTPEELRQGKGRVTTRSQVQGLVDHPIGAVLEFPETGSDMGIAIGHRFRVSTPDFVNPKNNILYSLGGKRSIHRGVRCFLLLDKTTGDPVSCKQTKISCRSVKVCSFKTAAYKPASPSLPLNATGELFMKTLGFYCALREHGCSFAEADHGTSYNNNVSLSVAVSAEDHKTSDSDDDSSTNDEMVDEDESKYTLVSVLKGEGGCEQASEHSENDSDSVQDSPVQGSPAQGSSRQGSPAQGSSRQGSPTQDPAMPDPVVPDPFVQDPAVQDPVVQDPVVQDPVVQDPTAQAQNPAAQNPTAQNLVTIRKDVRSRRSKTLSGCKGNLLLEIDKYGHYFIRCEHYETGRRNHLRLRNLNEFDMGYLKVLFENDLKSILCFEEEAAKQGYGPLVSCSVMAAAREQKQLCPMWHRDNTGVLQRGTLKKMNDCHCRFEIYQPDVISQCPYILVVSRNPHSHPVPPRMKTPQSIQNVFMSLLKPLDWRLADATPRRLLLDNAFVHNLRQLLSWTDFREPGLGDIHPSLVNNDHVARLINKLRFKQYPEGTGLEGAKNLLKEQRSLPPEEQYLRCVETCTDRKEGTFHIVICMYRAMSHLLLKTKRPSIDTSFKRLHKWQEFEVEAWFPEYARSVVVARAFTTSQSGIAHHKLFTLMFDIVKQDTGKSVQFRHIHGDGFDTITADGHAGQALGLGLYCQTLCEGLSKHSTEWKKTPLHKLTPTQHLACFYRYCFTHYTRNIYKLRGRVSSEVMAAMMSLASADKLLNYDKVLRTIRSGGKKASAWLKDKEKNNKLLLAAVYRPLSKMSLEIWKAAPSTSNGNEQAHRNINRDGVKLTMLAGIMRGLQFDSRVLKNIDFWLAECIPPRDRLATHFRRAARGIQLKTTVQQKVVVAKDAEIQNLCEKAAELEETITTVATSVKRSLDSYENPASAQKRLKQCDKELQETLKQVKVLATQGSGSVSLDNLPKPEALYDRQLLNAKPKEKPAKKPVQKQPTQPLPTPNQEAPRPSINAYTHPSLILVRGPAVNANTPTTFHGSHAMNLRMPIPPFSQPAHRSIIPNHFRQNQQLYSTQPTQSGHHATDPSLHHRINLNAQFQHHYNSQQSHFQSQPPRHPQPNPYPQPNPRPQPYPFPPPNPHPHLQAFSHPQAYSHPQLHSYSHSHPPQNSYTQNAVARNPYPSINSNTPTQNPYPQQFGSVPP